MKNINVPHAVKDEWQRLNEELRLANGKSFESILNAIIGFTNCFAKMHGIEWIDADVALRNA